MSTPTPIPAGLPSEPVQPALSEPQRIIDTFIAPSKTFIDIRRNASWWVPWLIASVLGIGLFVAIDKKVGFEEAARKMLESSSQFQSQPPEAQDRGVRAVAGFIKVSGYASPVIVLIYGLIIAAVLMATFNFGFAAEVPFSQSMAIVFYSWLPSCLSALIGFFTVWFGNPEGFNLQNPVGTNPAYYMDPASTPKFVYTLLTGFDVINFWLIALMGLGFALNSKRKMSIGTGITVVAVWYLLVKLVGAGFAAMRG